MMIQAFRAPPVGSYVEILLPEASITGRVVWSSDRRFGITARERIPLARFIGGKSVAPIRAEPPSLAQRHAALARRKADATFAARSMQYGFLALVVLAAALAITSIAFNTLSGVRETILEHL